jgi:hypothetical protein
MSPLALSPSKCRDYGSGRGRRDPHYFAGYGALIHARVVSHGGGADAASMTADRWHPGFGWNRLCGFYGRLRLWGRLGKVSSPVRAR